MDIPLPSQFKPLGHYLKLAVDFDRRDPVISYWCRYHAVQTGLAIDKSSPEAKNVIIKLLGLLEQKKKELHDNESITNDQVAEAYIEEYIIKLFSWADNQDRNAIFNKNVVKAFYNAGVLIDVLCNFNDGQLSEEFEDKRKYAKWKAAHIHNCLKAGITPTPGPMPSEEDTDELTLNVPQNPSNTSNVPIAPDNASHSYNYDPAEGTAAAAFSDGSVSSQPSWSEPQPQPLSVPSDQLIVTIPTTQDGSTLGVDKIAKAQKYCKWAGSALTFDDVSAAITNLENALHLLKTGVDLG